MSWRCECCFQGDILDEADSGAGLPEICPGMRAQEADLGPETRGDFAEDIYRVASVREGGN